MEASAFLSSNIFVSDVWVNPYTDEAIPFEGVWDVGKPDGQEIQNCVRSVSRKWNDVECNSLNCALCYFPNKMNLTMRGLCKSETNEMEGYFDTVYFLKGFMNGQPVWRGLGKSHLFYLPNEQKWKLESFYDQKRFAYYEAQDSNPYLFYPTGRGDWKINSGICRLANFASRRLSLTNCVIGDGKTDFTCRDGTCIPINDLCDLTANCPDKTDEKDCQQLTIPADYKGEKFPILDSKEPLKLFTNISILSFPTIDTLQSTYLVDFVISLRWLDPRLTYRNLKETFYLNAIPFDVVQKMWIPEMSMPNALQAEGTVVDKGATVIILKDGRSMKDDLSIAREAKVYLGTECPVVYKKEYFIRFSCIFDLQMYPFDSNICTLVFEVSGINKDYIQLLIDSDYGGSGAEYTGEKDLLEYTVGDVAIDNLSNDTENDYGQVMVSDVK